MKYKVGDKVRVWSRAWWDKQPKDSDGDVMGKTMYFFTKYMARYCGQSITIDCIDVDHYHVKEDGNSWEDWMLEPAYTYAELDLPDWWDGRPILGYVSDESEEAAIENKFLFWVWPNFANPGYPYRAVSKNGGFILSSQSTWKYFVPAEQDSRKVCITVKENGESKEIELTEAQIKQLGL